MAKKKLSTGNAFDLTPKPSAFVKDNGFNGKNLKMATTATIGTGRIDYRQTTAKAKHKVKLT